MATGATARTGQPAARLPRFRACAVLLVVASGIVLFFLAIAAQTLVQSMDRLNRQAGIKYPYVSEQFFNSFGHPHEFSMAMIVTWFWWPMVLALAYCHLKLRDNRDFAIAFIYAFTGCWMLIALAVAFGAVACSLPWIGLHEVRLGTGRRGLADWLLNATSLLLPCVTLLLSVGIWRQARRCGLNHEMYADANRVGDAIGSQNDGNVGPEGQ